MSDPSFSHLWWKTNKQGTVPPTGEKSRGRACRQGYQTGTMLNSLQIWVFAYQVAFPMYWLQMSPMNNFTKLIYIAVELVPLYLPVKSTHALALPSWSGGDAEGDDRLVIPSEASEISVEVVDASINEPVLENCDTTLGVS